MAEKKKEALEECKRLDVKWSLQMCAIEEEQRQTLRENCEKYAKFVHCAELANVKVKVKVVSGGIALTTNWINWLIVMMTVIVVNYCI